MYHSEAKPSTDPSETPPVEQKKTIKTKAKSNCKAPVFIPSTRSLWLKAFDIQLIGEVSATQRWRLPPINYLLLKIHSGTWGVTLQP